MIGPPYFVLDDEALLAHFAAAARACAPTPFYVYELERASGYQVPLEVIASLRDQAANFVGMKVSDTPWERFAPYLLDGLEIFVGPESLIHRGLAGGAVGAVSALATAFPELVGEAVRSRTEPATATIADLRVVVHPRRSAARRAQVRAGPPRRPDRGGRASAAACAHRPGTALARPAGRRAAPPLAGPPRPSLGPAWAAVRTVGLTPRHGPRTTWCTRRRRQRPETQAAEPRISRTTFRPPGVLLHSRHSPVTEPLRCLAPGHDPPRQVARDKSPPQWTLGPPSPRPEAVGEAGMSYGPPPHPRPTAAQAASSTDLAARATIRGTRSNVVDRERSLDSRRRVPPRRRGTAARAAACRPTAAPWFGGSVPFSSYAPTRWYRSTGSSTLWVRAYRQWRLSV